MTQKPFHGKFLIYEIFRLYIQLIVLWDFPSGASGKEPTCQYRKRKRCRLDPWVRKTLWRRAQQPTPVFLPGESPWIEKPGWLLSIGLRRVGHDGSNLACPQYYMVMKCFISSEYKILKMCALLFEIKELSRNNFHSIIGRYRYTVRAFLVAQW